MTTAVTGIQPSGTPHLGNYFGMIEPALALAEEGSAVYFVADLHALTTVRDPRVLERLTFEVTATWVALGLDPDRSILYRQSDLPEVCELAWVLSCVTAKGLLNRGHAYKTLVDENRRRGRPLDDGVSAGVFNYPLLMAADILIHNADLVPVGVDNRQHIEITRDVAAALNTVYGDVFTLPEAVIADRAGMIPGTDGRKMSKSYNNVIPIFAKPAELNRRVMAIVTDSRRPNEPKDPATCTVFALYQHLATPDEVADLAARYEAGTVGYREAKQLLLAAHERRFGSARQHFDDLHADRGRLEAILADGAHRARAAARRGLGNARQAVGITAPNPS
jgi:tryptophanyl-tRNA synthetase